ncbi:TetR family transcriptional regulator [Arthrobacter sp. JSM 101049]|uniref:TetR/AcrR family transcriptional regulator n=1 Tax=Arthrobacter sp. JSM 101049 TaxID=929097 RepID=UPI00356366A2
MQNKDDGGSGRRRGRPRGSASGSGRDRILAAATAEFHERGYESASIRSIARRADVDSSLVHHYFDDKAGLFTEVVRVPLRPDRIVAEVLDGPSELFGRRLVHDVLTAWERPAVRPAAIALMRSAVGTGAGSTMVRSFLKREMLGQLARRVGGPDAELRASLAASQMAGLLLMRFVLGIEPLATAPIGQLVDTVGPVVQWHLTGRELPGTVDRDPHGTVDPEP